MLTHVQKSKNNNSTGYLSFLQSFICTQTIQYNAGLMLLFILHLCPLYYEATVYMYVWLKRMRWLKMHFHSVWKLCRPFFFSTATGTTQSYGKTSCLLYSRLFQKGWLIVIREIRWKAGIVVYQSAVVQLSEGAISAVTGLPISR